MTGEIAPGGDWTFRLQHPDGSADLFFEHLDDPPPPSNRCDSAVVGTLLFWMSQPVDTVRVRGSVSGHLLCNLDELQGLWCLWRPQQYHRIIIDADDVIDGDARGQGSVAAFSGGVDSAFTLHRHAIERSAHSLDLRELAMVQGFDIHLDEDLVFRRAFERARVMAASAGVELTGVRSNLREAVPQKWTDAFGLCVSAVLLTFADRCRHGLIGSAFRYDELHHPWGSSPLQDWMASTHDMQIRHDGASFNRSQKVAALSGWPAATDNLRVCWAGQHHDRNCGHCEKCIRTVLNFRACGASLPRCFARDVTDEELRAVRLTPGPALRELEGVLRMAQHNGVEASWTAALRSCVRRSRLRSTVRRRWQDVRSWLGRTPLRRLGPR